MNKTETTVRILNYVKEHKTKKMKTVALDLGLSYAQVKNVMTHYLPHKRIRINYSEQSKDKVVIELCRKGKTVLDISKKTGFKKAHIYYIINRYGIKRKKLKDKIIELLEQNLKTETIQALLHCETKQINYARRLWKMRKKLK